MATRLARRLAVLAALLWGAAAFAQAPESTASWKVSQKAVSDDEFELIFTASIEPGWHIYTVDHEFNATTVEFDSPEGYAPVLAN